MLNVFVRNVCCGIFRANTPGPLFFTCFVGHRKFGASWVKMLWFHEPARREWWQLTLSMGYEIPCKSFALLMNINELILINVEFCYKSYLQVKSISLRYLRHFQSIDMVPTFPNTKKVTLGEPKYMQYWSPVNVKHTRSDYDFEYRDPYTISSGKLDVKIKVWNFVKVYLRIPKFTP